MYKRQGEEGPSEYVREALDLLKIVRLDHGNRSLDDESIVEELVAKQMALTVCPLSNLKLCVVKDMAMHPIKTMLDKGMLATVNSDDPAYFGGYMNENFWAIADSLNLSKQEITQLAKNGFIGSFMAEEKKKEMVEKIEQYYQKNR